MVYFIKDISEMSGVSPRTLRYYEELGLLAPKRDENNQYRLYHKHDIDRLQQIMIYRSLGVPISEIITIFNGNGVDEIKILQDHVRKLTNKKNEIDQLIQTVNRTLQEKRGETTMKDSEKFNGLKKQMMEDNEEKYGKELRQTFGDDIIDESNQQFLNLDKAAFQRQEELSRDILDLLSEVTKENDFKSEKARLMAQKHKEWIEIFWGKERYSSQAHRQLAQMYIQDDRFRSYYEDAAGEGAAELLKKSIDYFIK